MTTELPTQTDGGALTYRTDHVDEEQFDDKRSLRLLLIAHAATIVGSATHRAGDLDVLSSDGADTVSNTLQDSFDALFSG